MKPGSAERPSETRAYTARLTKGTQHVHRHRRPDPAPDHPVPAVRPLSRPLRHPHGFLAAGDDVAGPQLTSPARLLLAVDLYPAEVQQHPRVGAGVGEAGQLQELTQPDPVVPYLHV